MIFPRTCVLLFVIFVYLCFDGIQYPDFKLILIFHFNFVDNNICHTSYKYLLIFVLGKYVT